jgi:chromosomal replication initiation ATPase DnaA
VVEYSWVLSQFGRRRSDAQRKYRIYIEEGMRENGASPLSNVLGQGILRDKDFRDKIMDMLKGKELSHEIVHRKRLMRHKTPSEIIDEAAKAFGVDRQAIVKRGGRQVTARKAALYFVQHYAGLSITEIGKIFGGIHFSALSKAVARFKEEMEADRKLMKVIEKLNSNIKA